MNNNFPTDDMELTHILVVAYLDDSKTFYKYVLGDVIHSEYGRTSSIIKFQGNWLLFVTGGEPTKDKPDLSFATPGSPNTVNYSFIIRVQDCKQSFKVLKSRGAKFLTPPGNQGHEIRCFYLIRMDIFLKSVR